MDVSCGCVWVPRKLFTLIGKNWKNDEFQPETSSRHRATECYRVSELLSANSHSWTPPAVDFDHFRPESSSTCPTCSIHTVVTLKPCICCVHWRCMKDVFLFVTKGEVGLATVWSAAGSSVRLLAGHSLGNSPALVAESYQQLYQGVIWPRLVGGKTELLARFWIQSGHWEWTFKDPGCGNSRMIDEYVANKTIENSQDPPVDELPVSYLCTSIRKWAWAVQLEVHRIKMVACIWNIERAERTQTRRTLKSHERTHFCSDFRIHPVPSAKKLTSYKKWWKMGKLHTSVRYHLPKNFTSYVRVNVCRPLVGDSWLHQD